MKKTVVAIACLLATAASLVRAEEPSLRFQKEVSAAGKAEESLVAVTLDAEVYAATQPGLADLRLQDAQGTALPFIVRKSQELRAKTVRRKAWSAPKPTLKPLENGGLEITLVLDEDDPVPNGLNLITPLRNFEQRVRILTSADGQTWEPAGGETVIFDYSRYMDVRNDSVPFPASPRKQLRIVIDDVTLEQQSELLELTRRLRGNDETDRTEKVTIDRRPFRIERIEFWQESSQERVKGDHKQSYPVAGFKVTEDAKARQTFITVDTHREPLTSLQLETSSRNFSRNCVLEVQEQAGVQSTWRQISTATLSRMDFKNLKREQLTITFPEARHAQYRLVIDNRDSPPLTVDGVKAEGDMYEIIFLSATNKPHHLLYGDPDAKPPNYDTATIHALLTESYRPEAVKLGPEQKVAGAAPPGFKWSHLVNDPRLLTAIILILVLVLGWGLYGAVKRMDSVPPHDPPQP